MNNTEINLMNAHIAWDSLDTALIELKNANSVILEYVEDEDIKEDYFAKISKTQLVLEQVTWIAFIDFLIADIKLNSSGEYNTSTSVEINIAKLEELRVFLEDTTNLLKELI